MQQCLVTPKIVKAIVDFVGANFDSEQVAQSGLPQQRSGSSGADLAALARTAQAFHPLAIDRLWCKQDGLVNVMKGLPGRTWSVTDHGERVRTCSLIGLLHSLLPHAHLIWRKMMLIYNDVQ